MSSSVSPSFPLSLSSSLSLLLPCSQQYLSILPPDLLRCPLLSPPLTVWLCVVHSVPNATTSSSVTFRLCCHLFCTLALSLSLFSFLLSLFFSISLSLPSRLCVSLPHSLCPFLSLSYSTSLSLSLLLSLAGRVAVVEAWQASGTVLCCTSWLAGEGLWRCLSRRCSRGQLGMSQSGPLGWEHRAEWLVVWGSRLELCSGTCSSVLPYSGRKGQHCHRAGAPCVCVCVCVRVCVFLLRDCFVAFCLEKRGRVHFQWQGVMNG